MGETVIYTVSCGCWCLDTLIHGELCISFKHLGAWELLDGLIFKRVHPLARRRKVKFDLNGPHSCRPPTMSRFFYLAIHRPFVENKEPRKAGTVTSGITFRGLVLGFAE